MSLVAAPRASNPAPNVADAIAGDDFYPALSIAAFRSAQRVPEAVTDLRVREAVVYGMIGAAGELATWQAAQAAAGIAALVDVPGELAGEPRAVILWRRAVYSFAAADLTDTHHDISATADGRHRQADRSPAAAELLRAATLAIRDLTGKRRSRVALL